MAASMPPGLPLRTQNITFNPIRSNNSCTHRNLTRIYDKYGVERCPTCHRVPDLGYLYRCTQDTNGDLPISDFVDEDMSMDLADLKVNINPKFSNPPDPTSETFAYSMHNVHPAGTVVTTDETMEDADAATDETLARAFDGKRKFETAFPPRPPALCKCNLKICHTCRPVYKDRAWQSLNNVINTPQAPPSQFELDNRRVSNAAVILSMRPSVRTPFSNIRNSITSSWEEDEEQQPTETVLHSSKSRASGLYRWTSTSQPIQNPKITRLQRYDAHSSDASDADDEKDATQDDESEDSSTDFGGYDESYSEAEDGSSHLHSKRCSVRPMAQKRSFTPSDRPAMHVSSNIHGAGLSARSKDGLGTGCGEKSTGHTDDKRVTPGRFVID